MVEENITGPLRVARRMDQDELIVGINVTPLVDIVLVLLVVMMVAAAYVTAESIPMDMPSPSVAAPEVASLRVAVDPRGFRVDGARVSLRTLKARIRAFAAAGGGQGVVAGTADASHGDVVTVIDVLRREGVDRIGFEAPD